MTPRIARSWAAAVPGASPATGGTVTTGAMVAGGIVTGGWLRATVDGVVAADAAAARAAAWACAWARASASAVRRARSQPARGCRRRWAAPPDASPRREE